ncbi:F-box protein PP2-A13-like [Hordeum vulgare]|nr:F-box protein PP2-A13-like [Hordeum vulgare]
MEVRGAVQGISRRRKAEVQRAGRAWTHPTEPCQLGAWATQVLLRLDAPEICRLARLNHAFRGAAGGRLRVGGQAVGELPPPHRYVEGGGEEGRRRRHRAGTKEIYARLSRPVSFDDGTKEFWLEKSKGILAREEQR